MVRRQLAIDRRHDPPSRRLLAWAVAVGLLGISGCGPAVQLEPAPFDEDDPRALSGSLARAEPQSSPSTRPVPRRLRRSAVSRRALHAVLDRGPGPFLRGVELAPHFRDGRFDGWKIIQFMPGETRFDTYDLVPGDIIGPVNGQLVVKPPQLVALWTQLRSADVIVVEVMRSGHTFELRLQVTDAAGQPAADTGQ
ncbi:MAG: hypothetical protein MJE77_19010 [Proteobacteria bacterium]|nr:hypothetical protein [Pseudomonadota bacterium]